MDAILKRMLGIVVEVLSVDGSQVHDDSNFVTDLGADSLDLV